MSYIVRFSVDGLAGRKETLRKELCRDDNVIFGLNGSGKTSLLKILHSAMANDTSILWRVPFRAAEVEIYSAHWKKTFTRKIVKPREPQHSPDIVIPEGYPQDSAAPQGRVASSLAWSCGAEEKGACDTAWFHEWLPTSRLHVDSRGRPILLERSFERPQLTEDQLDEVFAASVTNLWTRYSTEVLVAVRAAQEAGLASILEAVLAPGKTRRSSRQATLLASTAYGRIRTFLQRQSSPHRLGTPESFERRYKRDKTLQNVVKYIDEIEQDIEEAMKARQKLEALIAALISGNKQVKFLDQTIEVQTSEGKGLSLANLSSGEKHLLRILVQTLLGKDNTIIIDEPEISLHVDWQSHLLSYMRTLSPEIQIIMATHSPEIMADVADAKIFRL